MTEAQQRMAAAQIQVGDHVRIGERETWFRVTGVDDPSLVELESHTGARLKVGRMAVSEIHRPEGLTKMAAQSGGTV